MGRKTAKNFDSLERDNAEILAALIIDPNTTDALRVSILNKLLDSTSADNFFETIVKEDLSLGACPECGHMNHWLVPEEDLNRFGVVAYENDPRVKRMTTAADCPRWQEACAKKKVSI
jgi:hypothetical protein